MLNKDMRIELEDPTVEDLIRELKKLPDLTLVNFNGYPYGYIHIDTDYGYIILTHEPLEEDYDTIDEEFSSLYR